MTAVGCVSTPAPHCTTSMSRQPRRCSTELCSASSIAADEPFRASNRPPGFSSGRHHLTNRSKGATARAVTQSAFPISATIADSSARPRTTRTVPANWSFCTASSRNATRRCRGSINSTRRSGRRMAIARPGSPAPLPTSITRAPGGSRSVTIAQLSRWRSHSRGTSRGPIRPRVKASVARSCTKRRARPSRSRKTDSASAGGSSRSSALVVSTGPVARTSSLVGQDDNPPVRLLTVGLTPHSVDGGDGIVYHLALERVHRRQPNGFT